MTGKKSLQTTIPSEVRGRRHNSQYLPPEKKELNKSIPIDESGLFCGKNTYDPIPRYRLAGGEKLVGSANNAIIVIGHDRPGGYDSGYGGAGWNAASDIYMCAGLNGMDPKEFYDGQPVEVDRNFHKDSAFIHISQMSDVDSNLGIGDTFLGAPDEYISSKGKSSIALKADHLRVIGREGVVIMSRGTDSRNSQNGGIIGLSGVHLVGNWENEMMLGSQEPLVKGHKLVELLESLIKESQLLMETFSKFLTFQMKFNEAVASHQHIGFMGVMTQPSIMLAATGLEAQIKSFETMLDSVKGDVKQQALSFQYLGGADPETGEPRQPGLLSDHILSKYNTTN